jgi:hypothetical protein
MGVCSDGTDQQPVGYENSVRTGENAGLQAEREF